MERDNLSQSKEVLSDLEAGKREEALKRLSRKPKFPEGIPLDFLTIFTNKKIPKQCLREIYEQLWSTDLTEIDAMHLRGEMTEQEMFQYMTLFSGYHDLRNEMRLAAKQLMETRLAKISQIATQEKDPGAKIYDWTWDMFNIIESFLNSQTMADGKCRNSLIFDLYEWMIGYFIYYLLQGAVKYQNIKKGFNNVLIDYNLAFRRIKGVDFVGTVFFDQIICLDQLCNGEKRGEFVRLLAEGQDVRQTGADLGKQIEGMLPVIKELAEFRTIMPTKKRIGNGELKIYGDNFSNQNQFRAGELAYISLDMNPFDKQEEEIRCLKSDQGKRILDFHLSPDKHFFRLDRSSGEIVFNACSFPVAPFLIPVHYALLKKQIFDFLGEYLIDREPDIEDPFIAKRDDPTLIQEDVMQKTDWVMQTGSGQSFSKGKKGEQSSNVIEEVKQKTKRLSKTVFEEKVRTINPGRLLNKLAGTCGQKPRISGSHYTFTNNEGITATIAYHKGKDLSARGVVNGLIKLGISPEEFCREFKKSKIGLI